MPNVKHSSCGSSSPSTRQRKLAEQAKVRARERRARKRREKGIRTREAYFAELASKARPWMAPRHLTLRLLPEAEARRV